MITLKQTETFRKWWTGLRDKRALGLILSRLDRLAYGNAGDVNRLGMGSARCVSITVLAAAFIFKGAGTR
mgnify:FL=1